MHTTGQREQRIAACPKQSFPCKKNNLKNLISNVSLQASPDKVENKQQNPSLKRYFGQTTFITCLVITVEIFLFFLF